MERPTDWSPVSRASDPTPGDPVVVRTGGQQYQGIAAKLTRAATTLRAMAAGTTSGSQSVAALLENRDELTTQVETAATRYQTAGDALVDYSYALDRVQATTSQALARARSAQWDVAENTRLANLYARLAEQADTPEQAEQRVRYLRQESNRWDDVADGRTRVTSERQVVDQAVVDRDQAAQAASDRIEQITSNDGLNDSWWDNWGSKVVAWITDVAGLIASIAGILALLVCWIPVIGQALAGVLLVIAAVAAVIAALGNIALAATGERSWGEAVMSIVGAVLSCVGLGALKGAFTGLKTAMGAWKAAGGLAGQGGIRGLAVTGGSRILTTIRGLLRNMSQFASGARSAFMVADDRFLAFSAKALPESGFHDVVIHGTALDFGAAPAAWTHGLNYDHRVLAALLKRDPCYPGGPIRLLACDAGKLPNGAAQNLANKLGVDVLAPTGRLWAFQDGRLTIGSIPGVSTGRFELFRPGNVNAITGGT